MHRSVVLSLFFVGILAASSPFVLLGAWAQESTPPAISTWDDLPAGVKFEPIGMATVDELVAISELVSITRITYFPGKGASIAYGDPLRQGPTLLSAESGDPGVSANSTEFGPTLLLRAPGEVAVMTPGSTVPLMPHETVIFPAGTSRGIYNQENPNSAATIEVEIFPSSRASEGTDQWKTTQPLDPDLGVATALPAAPPVIALGQLTLESGAIVPAQTASRPELFSVVAGTMSLTTDSGGSTIRRAASEETHGPAETAVPGSETTLTVGDAVFVPPGATRSIGNDGDGPLILLALVFAPPPAVPET